MRFDQVLLKIIEKEKLFNHFITLQNISLPTALLLISITNAVL